jgi:hypothetical protein
MGGGRVPATGDIGVDIDDGTLARIGSPGPDVIGLDAKGGGSKQDQPSVADRIVSWARRQRGDRVGNGECFTLVDRALRNAGAHSASHYGDVHPDADYVWGTPVNLADLRPGDVIQFRDYSYDRVVVTETSTGTTRVEDGGDRPHHTAVVESVEANGAVTVLEQNIPPGRGGVRRTQLFFRGGTTESGNATTTITVRGTWWFYRPEAQ